MEYKISELEEQCDVNRETIRYYERKNLLQKPAKNQSGYRIYSEETVKRVDFIKRLQDLGFSLAEIDKLLGIGDQDAVRCANIFECVSKKEDEVQRQIEDLKLIESMLKDLKKRCPDEKDLYECPLLDVLIKV